MSRFTSSLATWGSIVAAPIGGYNAFVYLGPEVESSHEAALLALDRALFGGTSPTEFLAPMMELAPLRGLLLAAYIGFYFVLLATPLVLLALGARADIARLRIAVVTACAIGFALYLAYPARSPYVSAELSALYARPEFAWVKATVSDAETTNIMYPWDAFPSMHTCLGIVCVITLAPRARPRARIALFGWLLTLLTATLATGAHFAVDVVAGAALAVVSLAVARRVRPLDVSERP